MSIVYPSFCKLNLTLRVYGRESNGYHRIYSVFKRFSASESLTISSFICDNVKDTVKVDDFRIDGINIVEKTAILMRKLGMNLPAFEAFIKKTIPPGTGVGGGSGNAAAFYRFCHDFGGIKLSLSDLESLGSDVPFIVSGEDLAAVDGVGGSFSPLDQITGYRAILVIPQWRSSTVEAYKMLDSYYQEKWVLNRERAEIEALSLINKIRTGYGVGLLPNDFLRPLMEKYPEYGDIFRVFEDYGSTAWGLSGSGSSVFTLFPIKTVIPSGFFNSLSSLKSVEKILVLE